MNRIKTRNPECGTVTLDDIEFQVEYHYSPGTPDVWYLSNGDPGYPGDPPEVDIVSLKLWNVDLLSAIPSALLEKIYEKVEELAAEMEDTAQAQHDDYLEQRAEWRREQEK